ncbi:hypothetical protein L208DRAFT_1382492 [Tricholoma matsutake]|nr:hypothetical protein L208DRAFT_1382492 [Tricholoma matsutake 945]
MPPLGLDREHHKVQPLWSGSRAPQGLVSSSAPSVPPASSSNVPPDGGVGQMYLSAPNVPTASGSKIMEQDQPLPPCHMSALHLNRHCLIILLIAWILIPLLSSADKNVKANVSVVNSIVDQVLKVFTLQETSSSNMPSTSVNLRKGSGGHPMDIVMPLIEHQLQIIQQAYVLLQVAGLVGTATKANSSNAMSVDKNDGRICHTTPIPINYSPIVSLMSSAFTQINNVNQQGLEKMDKVLKDIWHTQCKMQQQLQNPPQAGPSGQQAGLQPSEASSRQCLSTASDLTSQMLFENI